MSSELVTLGPSARIIINDTNFGVVEGTLRESGDEAMTTDTENTGFKRRKTGLKELEVNVTAQRATDVSPHIAPLLLAIGQFVTMELLPDKDVATSYLCERMCVLNYESSFAVEGSKPQTIKIQLKSDDDYTIYDEV